MSIKWNWSKTLHVYAPWLAVQIKQLESYLRSKVSKEDPVNISQVLDILPLNPVNASQLETLRRRGVLSRTGDRYENSGLAIRIEFEDATFGSVLISFPEIWSFEISGDSREIILDWMSDSDLEIEIPNLEQGTEIGIRKFNLETISIAPTQVVLRISASVISTPISAVIAVDTKNQRRENFLTGLSKAFAGAVSFVKCSVTEGDRRRFEFVNARDVIVSLALVTPSGPVSFGVLRPRDSVVVTGRAGDILEVYGPSQTGSPAVLLERFPI